MKHLLQKKFKKLLPVIKLASVIRIISKSKSRSTKASSPAKTTKGGWTENDFHQLQKTCDTNVRIAQGVHPGFDGALPVDDNGNLKVVEFDQLRALAAGIGEPGGDDEMERSTAGDTEASFVSLDLESDASYYEDDERAEEEVATPVIDACLAEKFDPEHAGPGVTVSEGISFEIVNKSVDEVSNDSTLIEAEQSAGSSYREDTTEASVDACGDEDKEAKVEEAEERAVAIGDNEPIEEISSAGLAQDDSLLTSQEGLFAAIEDFFIPRTQRVILPADLADIPAANSTEEAWKPVIDLHRASIAIEGKIWLVDTPGLHLKSKKQHLNLLPTRRLASSLDLFQECAIVHRMPPRPAKATRVVSSAKLVAFFKDVFNAVKVEGKEKEKFEMHKGPGSSGELSKYLTPEDPFALVSPLVAEFPRIEMEKDGKEVVEFYGGDDVVAQVNDLEEDISFMLATPAPQPDVTPSPAATVKIPTYISTSPRRAPPPVSTLQASTSKSKIAAKAELKKMDKALLDDVSFPVIAPKLVTHVPSVMAAKMLTLKDTAEAKSAGADPGISEPYGTMHRTCDEVMEELLFQYNYTHPEGSTHEKEPVKAESTTEGEDMAISKPFGLTHRNYEQVIDILLTQHAANELEAAKAASEKVEKVGKTHKKASSVSASLQSTKSSVLKTIKTSLSAKSLRTSSKASTSSQRETVRPRLQSTSSLSASFSSSKPTSAKTRDGLKMIPIHIEASRPSDRQEGPSSSSSSLGQAAHTSATSSCASPPVALQRTPRQPLPRAVIRSDRSKSLSLPWGLCAHPNPRVQVPVKAPLALATDAELGVHRTPLVFRCNSKVPGKRASFEVGGTGRRAVSVGN